ncbi:hypothetical protein TGVEG_279100A [Toxoplasma gondii VEG]|uniref:Uncharacterized protein n=1 Tax=Toxoplasma gondii (strain ATCC 50861 / VEG) TaxID=432359 RepID=V4ZCQ6_TOXGV|nr:hypothetical protein TGVEG_279100A [Toxoplasma gondii VEG]
MPAVISVCDRLPAGRSDRRSRQSDVGLGRSKCAGASWRCRRFTGSRGRRRGTDREDRRASIRPRSTASTLLGIAFSTERLSDGQEEAEQTHRPHSHCSWRCRDLGCAVCIKAAPGTATTGAGTTHATPYAASQGSFRAAAAF